jgi:hypothetical protein
MKIVSNLQLNLLLKATSKSLPKGAMVVVAIMQLHVLTCMVHCTQSVPFIDKGWRKNTGTWLYSFQVYQYFTIFKAATFYQNLNKFHEYFMQHY